MIGRCGWLLKTFHTFFDYWSNTKKSMLKSGRVMNDWPINDGGVPPNFKHIKTCSWKVRQFVDELLGHTTIPVEMQNLFAANGLRFYSDFCNILLKEPNGKYDSIDKQRFNSTFCFKVRCNLTNIITQ